MVFGGLRFSVRLYRPIFGPESDIDVLVEFAPDRVPGLLGVAGMEIELSALFGGRRVELRTPEDLSRYFRQRGPRFGRSSICARMTKPGLLHMLEAAREALSFARGRTRDDLDCDRQLLLALIKDIEIVGEAAAPSHRTRTPGCTRNTMAINRRDAQSPGPCVFRRQP